MRQTGKEAGCATRDGKRLNIAFVLAKRFTLTPFALFVDVLRLAGDDGDRSRRIRYDWAILGDSGLPVEASCGVRVLPTAPFDTRAGYDAVVVVGGLLEHLLPLPRNMERFLRDAVARGTPLLGLCTGSFILAELGLLDHRRASVSWFHIYEFRERYPDVAASAETLYVMDDSVSTCSGGTGAADFAAEFVRRRAEYDSVENAAKILLMERLRDPQTPQPMTAKFARARDPLVKRALLFMESNLATVQSVAVASARTGCTVRQLQRRFLADLGVTPSQAYMSLRLQAACRLLSQTDKLVEEVGLAVGFVNPAHFSRSFRKQFGQSPSGFRSQVAT